MRLILAAVTVSAAAGYLAASLSPDATSFNPATRGVEVASRAFVGLGELAFISSQNLYVLDGSDGAVQPIALPDGMTPLHPVFSADGRWLAFLASPWAGDRTDPRELWIASGDGAGARQVAISGGVDQLVGWSPTNDQLAVVTGPTSSSVPYGEPTRSAS